MVSFRGQKKLGPRPDWTPLAFRGLIHRRATPPPSYETRNRAPRAARACDSNIVLAQFFCAFPHGFSSKRDTARSLLAYRTGALFFVFSGEQRHENQIKANAGRESRLRHFNTHISQIEERSSQLERNLRWLAPVSSRGAHVTRASRAKDK